ncbi:preprotein translocase subunit SecG [Aureibacter tunicatorum]|uniref:Protein-export membrane protein SecG n=1 Tax=Aureibacter tunicatorum TaxID=866807 RepID=A0AAE3XNV8_9BACT|nr:preprotein translocase subunit SecG [Aureibacter tunicatorum]MDR6239339.1 preprotein translocase subunit SecG [Aureibacter tunicatorum]BDD04738.1 preprotein translocase subunit SecG [Aureibacter tunicatorum]
MFTLIITLIIIVAVLLILVVLAQKSKGGGLNSNASGASQLMGVQRTGDFLEKTTWGLAIALVVLTLSTKIFIDDEQNNNTFSSPNIEKAQQDMSLPNTIGGTEELPQSTAPAQEDSAK